ncbi:TRAP transporter substrate-binding protein [Caballeronia sp. LP006]|jgi:tripartite ATP-independent transporter DctP family solute receptor|uniref:TRAP transporter substrate-binding protein n=1 Tax=unclassified Caballeronia TaxID=2646786 RepID=UPI001FD201DA|nr:MULTISPECIES: TRAP transporter substrate-binding protein [unclassified Caballeronia]MDR5774423.1 TRAP transporter substrate-binding protein [Caballeronia sp. LZ002]MDR5826407.1 TRAP transporter substrate-binding protein [Caballeronia sp. LP006]MDR5849858.1 TRAP transporter substrate-binding protein [Caballeronia sp. LZ003]
MNSLFKAHRSLRVTMSAVLAALCVAATGSAMAQDKVVMKLGHTLAPDNHYQLTAQVFAKEVAQRTHGHVEIQLFPQSQLGGEVQMAQALRTGTQELMISAQAPIDNTIKQWQIFDMPYLFSSMDEANKVLQGPVGRKYLDMMQPVNMVGLTWLAVGERNLFTTKRPVTSLADMKDLKVRVMQSPGYIAGYKALGANPTPLAYNQLFLALSQGLVDGADTSPEQFVQDKFSDVAKHFYVTHVNYLPVVLAMSKSAWTKLSPADQKAFQESAAVAADFDLKEYKREYDAALATMKAKGIQVTMVDTAPWAEATKSARDELVAKIPDGAALYAEMNAAKQASSVASK